MHTSQRLYRSQILLLFSDESFSQRDAWNWVIANSINGKISCSIRYMAQVWQWHRSKVERFLQKLKSASLIKTVVESGKLVITICNCKLVYASHNIVETYSETTSSQDQDTLDDQTQLQDSNGDAAIQEASEVTAGIETTPSLKQVNYPGQEEEKKKRTKKRKEEELLKEKNIPYGDTKKEKFVPFHLVQASDVEAWVNEELRTPIDFTWELGKFKDHWFSTRKKPPKDGIAAFRNWLRTSLEINKKYRGRNERFNNKTNEPTGEVSIGFERFLAGGARALAKLSHN